MIERGWYRFEGRAGAYFWDGLRWHVLMVSHTPVGEPIKDEPPK